MIDSYGIFEQNSSRTHKMADKSETRFELTNNAVLIKKTSKQRKVWYKSAIKIPSYQKVWKTSETETQQLQGQKISVNFSRRPIV